MIINRRPTRRANAPITIRRPDPGGSTEWLQYRYLNDWLRVATAGLSDDSRARIRAEIGDHFDDAVEEALGAGMTEEAAAEGAVKALGSPQRARRAFRRTNLTSWQAYFVRRFLGTPQPAPQSTLLGALSPPTPLWDPDRERLLRPLMVLILVSLTATGTLLGTRVGVPHLLLLAAMAVAALVNVFAAPRLGRRGQERAAIIVGVCSEVALWSAFILAPALSLNHNLPARISLVAAFAAFNAIVYAPILRKLRRHHESSA